MTDQTPEQSSTIPNEHTYAFAPTETFEAFLEAICHSKRDVPGFVTMRVRIAEWDGPIPLSELYGVLDKLRSVGGSS